MKPSEIKVGDKIRFKYKKGFTESGYSDPSYQKPDDVYTVKSIRRGKNKTRFHVTHLLGWGAVLSVPDGDEWSSNNVIESIEFA